MIALAEGEAERFTQLLTEYEKAPEVTRERLYIDAVQTVFANTNKVLVDVEGGNNVMYLPLDKLAPRADSSSGSSSARGGISDRQIRELTDAVAEQLRREADSASSRRGGR